MSELFREEIPLRWRVWRVVKDQARAWAPCAAFFLTIGGTILLVYLTRQ